MSGARRGLFSGTPGAERYGRSAQRARLQAASHVTVTVTPLVMSLSQSHSQSLVTLSDTVRHF